jgi:hypothetical protein
VLKLTIVAPVELPGGVERQKAGITATRVDELQSLVGVEKAGLAASREEYLLAAWGEKIRELAPGEIH